MDQIKAVIIDDEEGARNVLNRLLEKSCPNIKVVGQARDLMEGTDLIKRVNPAVVFLDVQMPQYAGYEIVNFFDEINFEIIFTTAYDQFAIKAFELNAIDYLLKPIDRNRLIDAAEKLEQSIANKKELIDYKRLLNSMQEKQNKKIVISELGGRRAIELSSIIAIQGQGAYSTMHLNGIDNLMVSKNLKYFEGILTEEDRFFRAHKSWIINLEHVVKYAPTALEIELKKDLTTKLSKYKKVEFEALFEK